MKRSQYFWLYVLIFLALPFLLAEQARKKITGRDPVPGKKRWTNIFGVVVMMVFVMAIIVTGAIKWTKTQAQVKEAGVAVNEVTKDFSEGKGVDSWAKGELADPWGNGYILVKNDPDGVQMRSKGPDGEEGTKDDITSEVHVPPVPEPPEPPKPKKEKKPSLMERAKGLFSRD